MRVFLPSTLPALAEALRAGHAGQAGLDPSESPGQQPGYAVTPALREAYASGDEEELEYAALTEAARASLRMLAGNPAAPPRRVVLAAEIPADGVKLDARDREPGRVLVTAAIPIDKVASAHVDDAEAGTRSEERRVGKECRYRWSPYHYKKKKNMTWSHNQRQYH